MRSRINPPPGDAESPWLAGIKPACGRSPECARRHEERAVWQAREGGERSQQAVVGAAVDVDHALREAARGGDDVGDAVAVHVEGGDAHAARVEVLELGGV